ncbi:MAG: hypothetical protein QW837_06315 [Conexivisphaerales archaeon]
MNYIIMGGSGFIGSNLVEALARDNSVAVLDNFHTGTMDNLAGNLKSVDIEVNYPRLKPWACPFPGLAQAQPPVQEHRSHDT